MIYGALRRCNVPYMQSSKPPNCRTSNGSSVTKVHSGRVLRDLEDSHSFGLAESRHRRTCLFLVDISDEDLRRRNPMLGFLIAVPLGFLIWLPIIVTAFVIVAD